MTPASIIPVFGSQRPYADLNFAGGSFGLDGRSVSDITRLPGFTFTRASLAMGYDATGKLVYGPNNLLVQSQTFGNALWVPTGASIASDTTTAPDGTLTADTLIEDTSGSAHRLLPAVGNAMSFGIGAGMVGSLYVKSAGRSHAFIRINNSGGDIAAGNVRLADGVVTQTTSGTISAQVLANGWVRIAAYGVSANPAANTSAEVRCSNSDIYANYTGDGTSGLHIWGFQLEAVTYQTTPSTYYPTTTAAYYGPRLVYDPVTLASQGILVEEARTNLCLQSQDLATTWATSRTSVTVNTTTSPDGTSNADKLVEDVTLGGHQLVQAITTTAVATTISVYAKPAGRDWIALGLNDSGGVARAVYFNVSTGAVGTVGTGFAASIQAVGNGWYRCVATLSAALAGANNLRLYVTTADNVTSYTGDGTSGAFFWQAQVEAGTGASSPIPTTTAAVTRAADVAAVTGLSLAYPLSITVDAYRALDKGADEFWAQVDDGAATNRTVVQVNPSDKLEVGVATGGAGQGSSTSAASVPVGATSKAAARLATNSIAGALNGVLSPEDTAATMPSGPANLRIGSNQSGQAQPNYTISRIRIYNRALPDAQLQSLTT